MSSPIVQPASFSTSKVTISPPKQLPGGTGAKMAYLNYAEGRSLVMQTPSLPTPFGLSVFQQTVPAKYSIDLALRGYQDNAKVKAFYTALEALDTYMIDQGVKNGKSWFGKDKSREVIEDTYSRILKWSKDKEGNVKPYPPNIKLQFKKAKGTDDFECQFYDEKSKADPHAKPLTGIPLEEMLPKRAELTALIQCTGVWFAGGKFGLSFKAVQVRLDKVPQALGNYGFAADEEEAGEDQPFKSNGAAFAEPQEFATPSRPAKPVIADDSEDEEEEAAPAPSKPVEKEESEDESESEVAPPPVPKKTVITKKKVVAGKK